MIKVESEVEFLLLFSRSSFNLSLELAGTDVIFFFMKDHERKRTNCWRSYIT